MSQIDKVAAITGVTGEVGACLAEFLPLKGYTVLCDPSKANAKLCRTPKSSFDESVADMSREGLTSAERDERVQKDSYKTVDYHE